MAELFPATSRRGLFYVRRLYYVTQLARNLPSRGVVPMLVFPHG